MKYSDAEVNLIVISVMIPLLLLIALIYYFIMLPKSSRIKFNKVRWNYGHFGSYDCNKVIPIRSSLSGVSEKNTAAAADINNTNTPATAVAAVNYVREFSDVTS
jgi:hypothetical protein